jgi:DNA repair protein RadA/Sms
MNCALCGAVMRPDKYKCVSCGHWNNFDTQEKIAKMQEALAKDSSVILEDIVSSDVDRMTLGMCDKIFGSQVLDDGTDGVSGITRGSTNLVAGAPGAGKSTLFLQLCERVTIKYPEEGEVLYMVSEEQLPQIRSRADRMKIKTNRKLRFIDLRKGASDVASILRNYKFCFLILDSLKALAEDDATQIVICKHIKEYATMFHAPAIISTHINKGEEIAGLMSLQHEVDSTSTFFPIPEVEVDGEAIREHEMRKNRNGRAWIREYYSMTARGLVAADNPFPEGKEAEEDEEEDSDEEE